MDRGATGRRAESPYSAAPATSFWSRSVARGFDAAALLQSETVVFRHGDRIMSAGSCFASNIVPYVERAGYSYIRTEQRCPLFHVPGENLGYDNFSAAYGNVYTSRQLVQLLNRCLGQWEPAERVWRCGDEFVDPYRPGLRYRARSAREFDLLSQQHLTCVRQAFEDATVFVFTLGLTETWMSRPDGAAFPACPGTVAGTFDPSRHVFHNLSAGEVTSDLTTFIQTVRKINPSLRIVLTVSPVPLVATATGGHALTATVYSKSALRVACDEITQANRDVVYFPAYEIVTGPQAPHDFFEADRRHVSRTAIDTVMAALLAHCEGASPSINKESDQAASVQSFAREIAEAECEEELSDGQTFAHA